MRVQIHKWGNSLALRIPKLFASESHIDQGSTVDLTLIEGKLIITPIANKEYTLDELLAGVTKQNLHQEISTGQPVGKEAW
jgi:antitoxin MazE